MTKKVTFGSRWRGLESDLFSQRSGPASHLQRWTGLKGLCLEGTAPALDPTIAGKEGLHRGIEPQQY
jgi:hypothetical protein